MQEKDPILSNGQSFDCGREKRMQNREGCLIAELSNPEQKQWIFPRIHSPKANKCFLLYLDNENPSFYISGKSR